LAEPIETPCNLVCVIDMESGWCHGCGRTREEIASWSLMTGEQRRATMDMLPERVASIEKKPRRVTKRQRIAANKGKTPQRKDRF
jgi:predicted Fe-S protein YdhL (DUF1289 family)